MKKIILALSLLGAAFFAYLWATASAACIFSIGISTCGIGLAINLLIFAISLFSFQTKEERPGVHDL